MSGREPTAGRIRQVSDYRDQPSIRNGFHRLAASVFGVDFRSWQEHGFWDDRFTVRGDWPFAAGPLEVSDYGANVMKGSGSKRANTGRIDFSLRYNYNGYNGGDAQ